MNIRQLREALSQFGPGHDEAEIKVWLPGSKITLGNTIFRDPGNNGWLIEGNVAPGSALAPAPHISPRPGELYSDPEVV